MRDSILNADSAVARVRLPIAMGTIVVSKTNRVFFARKALFKARIIGLQHWCYSLAGAVSVSGVVVPKGTGLVTAPTLAIDANAVKFQIGAGILFGAYTLQEKAAATALTFTAAHVVTANLFGEILVQIDNAGTVTTKVVSATQAYATAGAAHAALPAPDANKVKIGTIAVAAGVADWVANTSDMTNASGATTVIFTAATALVKFATNVAFVSGAIVTGTITQQNVNTDDLIVLSYTSDGSGALVNGFTTFTERVRPLRGEP